MTLGLPETASRRDAYLATLKSRASAGLDDPDRASEGRVWAKARDEADGALGIVSGRSGTLAGIASVLLAVSSLGFFQGQAGPEHLFSGAAVLLSILAALLLLPGLWISYADDPDVYACPKREFERTMGLMWRRAFFFNLSVVLLFLALLSNAAASVIAVFWQ